MKLSYNVKITLAVLSFIAAIGFGVAGLIMPPMGSISGSVLILIAQLLVLCCTLIGIQLKIDLANKYFESSHIVEKIDEEKEYDKIQRIIDNQKTDK